LIVLHPGLTEDLIEFQSLDEITSRAAFARDIDPATTKLVKPIGIYRFREIVSCGLKSCHQPHRKGLVVLTADGEEVNIGHLCGKKHSPEEFAVYWNAAHRYTTRKLHVDVIREFKAVARRHLARIEQLQMQDKGAVWIENAMRRLREAIPGDAHQSLCAAARRGEEEVFEEVRIYGEEAERERQFGMRTSWGGGRAPTIRRESRGRIVGARIWHKEPHSALWSLEADIKEALVLDPLTCGGKKLRWAADVATQAERRLAECEALIEAGRRFFTEDNIRRLRFLPRVFESSRPALERLSLSMIVSRSKNRAA
jgi:hypothetical protein